MGCQVCRAKLVRQSYRTISMVPGHVATNPEILKMQLNRLVEKSRIRNVRLSNFFLRGRVMENLIDRTAASGLDKENTRSWNQYSNEPISATIWSSARK